MDALEQRQDLVPDQPAQRVRVRRVGRATARPRSRQNASVSSRQTQSSGRTTPSSRRTSMPFVCPARGEAVEDRLDLVGERVAGRAQPAWRGTSSGRRAARPRSSSALPPGRPRRRSCSRAPRRVRVGLRAAQAVVDVQRRDAVAELAQRVEEAGRVGAARDEAEHLAARLDQVVPADVRLDPRELQASAAQPRASAPRFARPSEDPDECELGPSQKRMLRYSRTCACRPPRRARSRARSRCGRRASRPASSRAAGGRDRAARGAP